VEMVFGGKHDFNERGGREWIRKKKKTGLGF
jgi:hypothetical protein